MEQTGDMGNPISQALARLRLRKAPRAVLSDYSATLLKYSDTPDREDLIRLISLDPLMAVWILKRANSSYYGLRSTVDSLTRAIDVLDETAIAGMFADTFGAERASDTDLPSDPPDQLTKHSVATAILSSILDNGDANTRGFVFTAGLLHDVGKHVFALNYPVESTKMYTNSSLWESLQGADLPSVEQLAFGLDHREVGEYVARKMHFSESLTEVLKNHATPSSLSKHHPDYRAAWIINAASYAATGLGYAAGESVSWTRCLSDPRWKMMFDEHLLEWDSTTVLFDAIEKAVDVIEDFLTFEVARSKTLMKQDFQTNRMNREPILGRRTGTTSPDGREEYTTT